MTRNEPKFRLRPRKPPRSRRRGDGAWAVLFKAVIHYARTTRLRRDSRAARHGARSIRPHSQRCAVRITYSQNSVRGQWRAHGRYLERDSATRTAKSTEAGFDAKGEDIEISNRLHEWQHAGDERLWKLIISPEFGERLNLKVLARQVMQRMENDLGTSLEWVSVLHNNTEHPHVHIALCGVDGRGKALKLEPDYIKYGIREIATGLCTNQLGYRTELDADAAARREVHQHRFTSLDSLIRNRAVQTGHGEGQFEIALEPLGSQAGCVIPRRESYIRQRLMVLAGMGLAMAVEPNAWRVSSDFENVLRSMQRVRDRQKTLAAHGAAISDERLPVQTLNFRERRFVEGRVLVHGEEDDGRPYLIIEGTDARVHHIYYTPEIEEARANGTMKTNAFVRLQKVMENGKPVLEINDFGDSEALLRDRKHFRESATHNSARSAATVENDWGGWLGRYQLSMRQATAQVAAEREQKQRAKARSAGR